MPIRSRKIANIQSYGTMAAYCTKHIGWTFSISILYAKLLWRQMSNFYDDNDSKVWIINVVITLNLTFPHITVWEKYCNRRFLS